jgi:hypothetical protein
MKVHRIPDASFVVLEFGQSESVKARVILTNDEARKLIGDLNKAVKPEKPASDATAT